MSVPAKQRIMYLLPYVNTKACPNCSLLTLMCSGLKKPDVSALLNVHVTAKMNA